ncbi:hypothetical protein RGQ29_020213 [Quercus rubra]|uniref:Uncharacterized protein n=1 Tax=Quercus rubra TaxID=3512 RepID=A0AAN7FEH9_QUERU|nr:hypothetical protein RGQ29_020213 [Quercus rubra]
MKVELVTVCPGLLMPPLFPNAHKATSTPYLKGPALLEFMMGMQCYMLIFITMEIVVFCDLF